MKNILWVSRHSMHGIQMKALRRMYGEDVKLVEDARPFDNAETIVRRYREGRFDDIIVVAPYSVLTRMVDLGLRPLWSEADMVEDASQADWSVKNRHYRFNRFRRVKGLVMEFEELGSEAERKIDD